MSVEIDFPLEFLVFGVPVSFQAKRKRSIIEWKEQVKQASLAALPEGHFMSDLPMSVTLYYFPAADMSGDLDNIIKPVLDALCRLVYYDDQQVERIVVQKFRAGYQASFVLPSDTLSLAIESEKPLLYVRLSNSFPERVL